MRQRYPAELGRKSVEKYAAGIGFRASDNPLKSDVSVSAPASDASDAVVNTSSLETFEELLEAWDRVRCHEICFNAKSDSAECQLQCRLSFLTRI
jgi:hypothetical protein